MRKMRKKRIRNKKRLLKIILITFYFVDIIHYNVFITFCPGKILLKIKAILSQCPKITNSF